MQTTLPLPLATSDDGFVHLTVDALIAAAIQHLASGLDDDPRFANDACGRPTDISGYTEWTCQHLPFVSLGWDWRVDCSATPAQWVRAGLPRTNLRLIDSERGPLPWQDSLEALARVVDAVAWQPQVQNAVLNAHD